MTTQVDLLDVLFEKDPAVVTRKVAGEVILVPITPQVQEDSSLFTLDAVAAFLWGCLQGQVSGRELVDRLTSAYQVETFQAEQDVRTFLQQLESIQAIRSGTQTGKG